ncbi:MAG: stage II sporulation protein R [Lachnospiraceae bacterium]
MTEQKERYQRLLIAVLSVILGIAGSYYIGVIQAQRVTASARIADKIVRFHVIPDNDSEADQELKRLVRNDLLEYFAIKQELLNQEGKPTKEAFLEEIKEDLPDLELLAESRIQTEGFAYDVKAVCEKVYFPEKIFEDYVFPEGSYDAIEIFIGDARGSNWWGVMYPNLCLTKGTYAAFSEETDEKLKDMLLAEDYESLLTAPREKVYVKCKTYELVKELLSKTP